MEIEKILNDEICLMKVFVWKRKWVYVSMWVLELEWFFNVRIKYEGSMCWVCGKGCDVLEVVSWIYSLSNR